MDDHQAASSAAPTAVEQLIPLAHDGIVALRALADGPLPDDAPTPCTGWTVRDLARHLEAIAGAYLLWASAGYGGRITDLRGGPDLAAWNATMLGRLPALATADHLRRACDLGEDHLRIAAAAAECPMARTPNGTELTVGEHVAMAAVEWHVHAWDLARATGTVHLPDGATLARAWHDRVAPALDLPLVADADPFSAVLRSSGRDPDDHVDEP